MYNFMAGHVSHRWNQLYPSLLLLAEKLEQLGFYYGGGKVKVCELPMQEVHDVRPL